MAYVNFKEPRDYNQFNDFWELRVHIDPSVLDASNPNNKIEIIKKILADVFGKDNVGLKIYSIADQNEKITSYDGALGHQGHDRTQVGKEVGIFLPDAAVQQLSSEEYKKRLLMLWKKLEANNIPLHYMNLPGDKTIQIAGCIASPFSFTSKNPNRDEWSDPHGILFKEFEACGQHPILGVDFSLDDLRRHRIHFKSSYLNQTNQYIDDHNTLIINDIAEELSSLDQQQSSYSEVLKDNSRSLDILNDLIDTCQRDVEGATENRGGAQEAFFNQLASNQAYQFLLNQYPHQPNKDFTSAHEILEIQGTIKTLTKERANTLIGQLRDSFESKVEAIFQDFQQKIDLHNLPEQLRNLSDADSLKGLIAKNPAKMQSIFRQLALLQQEQKLNIASQPAIQLLTAYKNNRRSKNTDYTGFFGSLNRIFGACTKKEKIDAADALISALKDGNKFDKSHLRALTQGDLGSIVKDLKIDLKAHVAVSQQLNQ